MPSRTDPIAAVVAMLKAHDPLDDLVDGRVFGGELPQAEAEQMPRPAVLVRYSGGGTLGTSYQQWGDVRTDLICYGQTAKTASDLWRICHPRLKQLARERWAECTLYWARESGGPLNVRDPVTEWPYCLSTWQVLAHERT